MIPDIKWLNSTGNKLFVIDADAYTLYRVIEEKNDSIKEFRAQQIVSCSPSLPIIKQEQVFLYFNKINHKKVRIPFVLLLLTIHPKITLLLALQVAGLQYSQQILIQAQGF